MVKQKEDILKEKGIKIVIPFKTPTYNHLYWHRGNMKILTTEARKLREEIKGIVVNSPIPQIQEETQLELVVEIHENWFTQKGKVARKDISNREKFLVDSVFNALEIDDKFIFKHSMNKVQSKKEKAVIKISLLKNDK